MVIVEGAEGKLKKQGKSCRIAIEYLVMLSIATLDIVCEF